MTHENYHHDEHRGPEHDESLPDAGSVQVFANVEDSLAAPLTEDITDDESSYVERHANEPTTDLEIDESDTE